MQSQLTSLQQPQHSMFLSWQLACLWYVYAVHNTLYETGGVILFSTVDLFSVFCSSGSSSYQSEMDSSFILASNSLPGDVFQKYIESLHFIERCPFYF